MIRANFRDFFSTAGISDGSDPRIGPGLARDRPFLEGSGSNFREGPKLGIGSGSISRIEGPEGPKDLLKLTK